MGISQQIWFKKKPNYNVSCWFKKHKFSQKHNREKVLKKEAFET